MEKDIVGIDGHKGAGPGERPVHNHAAFIWSVADLLRGEALHIKPRLHKNPRVCTKSLRS